MRMAVSGDCSAGFRIRELPVASAGPIFHEDMSSGKFHGHHRGHDAQRHAAHQRDGLLARGRDLVIELVDGFGIPADALGRERDIDLVAVADRLAHVQGLEKGELGVMLVDQIGEALQHLLAVRGRHIRPGALLEDLARGLDGAIHVFLVAFGHLVDDLACRGVDVVEGLAGGRGQVFAVDEGLAAVIQPGDLGFDGFEGKRGGHRKAPC